jgi:hypothetical protein
VAILLFYGAATNILNRIGNTPKQEAQGDTVAIFLEYDRLV